MNRRWEVGREGNRQRAKAEEGKEWVVALRVLGFLGSQRVQTGPGKAGEVLCPMLDWVWALTQYRTVHPVYTDPKHFLGTGWNSSQQECLSSLILPLALAEEGRDPGNTAFGLHHAGAGVLLLTG